MIEKLSEILKNLSFSLRLSHSSDCSVVLVKSNSTVTFQYYDNKAQKEFLKDRLRLIEWSNFIKYSANICKRDIGTITSNFKSNAISYKIVNDSILMVTLPNDTFNTVDVAEQLNAASKELKMFCNDVL